MISTLLVIVWLRSPRLYSAPRIDRNIERKTTKKEVRVVVDTVLYQMDWDN